MKPLKPIVSVPLRYGAIAGLLLFIAYLVIALSGKKPWLNLNVLVMNTMVYLIFLYIGMRSFRDAKNGGFLHFWQGMSVGFILYATASVVFAVSLAVLVSAEPALLAEYIQDLLTYLESNKAELIEQFNEAHYKEQVKLANEAGVGTMVFDALIKNSISGLFIAIAVAVILRRRSLLPSDGALDAPVKEK